MKRRSVWSYVPPAGPVLSLTLIGLVLLSALLYYRAIKIQRFLEPALAISQPRNEFTRGINQAFQKEFGVKPARDIKVKTSSILMQRSLLFSEDGLLTISARGDVRKFARLFLKLMDDEEMRQDISIILIIAKFPSYGPIPSHVLERVKAQRMTGTLQDALFFEEPELGRKYGAYFAAAAQPTNPRDPNRDLVEFRIIPSEFLHIEVLEKLEKYSR
ncbi:MAG TPA: hypothetical protein VIX18_02905 [Nitrospirota bacterium]